MKDKQAINVKLQSYIENEIIPQYAFFDKGHNSNHVEKVIKDSLEIALDYKVEMDMVYAIAAYHDIGMPLGRENHHITSGEILRNDKRLSHWFNEEQLVIMQQAIEDHRASGKNEPRTIYGKIVAEADRDISMETIIYRSIAFSIDKFPLDDYSQQLERVYFHIENKYGENGYLKLWIETPKNTKGLQQLRQLIEDKQAFMLCFKRIWDSLMINA